MKVSVIVLNWNGKGYLKDCLDALAVQTYRDFETIVVDNGSTDGSAGFVQACYPWVRLLALPENTGFAEGNNRGISACNGELIVTLNNDTRADPGFLAHLVEAADTAPDAGMVAARMRNSFRPELIDAAGLKVGTNGLGYNIGFGEVDSGQFDGEPVFGPCGGGALYRRTMLEEVGFFDSDFFAYYEDFDLAWRGRMAGWGCVAAPRALVYHVHSATSGERSSFKVFHTHRNKWFVILKNWPAALLVRHLPSILLTDAASFTLAVLRGKGWAALRARLAALRSLKGLLRKRAVIQGKRRLADREMEGLFSPGEHPFRTFLRKVGQEQITDGRHS